MSLTVGVPKWWMNTTSEGKKHAATQATVQTGLVLNLDAGVSDSYGGSGTTWTDLSSSGNNGTITGATHTSGVGGYFNFDGTDDYIQSGTVADWAFLHNGSTDFTIESWIYLSDSNDHTICATTASSADIGLYFGITSSTLQLNVQIYRDVSGSIANFGLSTSSLNLNRWYQVAFTFDSSSKTGRYYIDGVLSGSSTQSSFAYTSSNPSFTLQIFRYLYGASASSGYTNGRASIIKIHEGRLLTLSELAQNFDVYRGRFGI